MVVEIELLERIEAFLAKTGMNASDFGKAAINDRNLVSQLRSEDQPRELRRKTRERVEASLRDPAKTLRKLRAINRKSSVIAKHSVSHPGVRV